MSAGRIRGAKKSVGPGPCASKEYDPRERFGDKVKVIHVPYATGNSGIDARAPVTLPKPDWEREIE